MSKMQKAKFSVGELGRNRRGKLFKELNCFAKWNPWWFAVQQGECNYLYWIAQATWLMSWLYFASFSYKYKVLNLPHSASMREIFSCSSWELLSTMYGKWYTLGHSAPNGMFPLNLSPQGLWNCMKEEVERLNQRGWMPPRKLCIPDTAWLRHIWTHRDSSSTQRPCIVWSQSSSFNWRGGSR